ncbi:MAG TPA: hypothetical protein VIW03_18495, partial [Anaeromyxobacter sp.]
AGRVVQANEAAARVAGLPVASLLGREASALGGDLPLLLRGLARGPASGVVTVVGAAAPVRARAAAVRAGRRPAFDVVVLRPHPPARPPPLPRESGRGDGGAAARAISAALREPLSRAQRAISLLRLALPAVPALAAREIARLEEALADAERGLAAVAPEGAGRRRPVEVAALVADLLRTIELPPGVSVRRALAPGLVVADEARLRRALAEVLREAAAAMPSGGELSVGVARRGADLVVEVVDTGARAAADGATLARALLVEQGGRLEQVPVPGRGTVCRIALPAHVS